MLFNSIQFLLFFPITIIVYFLLPQKLRKYFLLAASCYFYMSFIPKYILILLFTTIVDFSAALLIERFETRPKLRKAIFVIGVTTNILLLVVFKYLGVLGDTINFFGAKIGLKTLVIPEIALPIGISFHTFQSMGYLIDIYLKKEKAEPNFIDFSLFLMYFPQLVAGPIERSRNLFSQLKAEHILKAENIVLGGRKMLWGMFKKVVVADNLALLSDLVFNHVSLFSGFGLVIGVLCFTVQIYCDFSGYSDIAIGAAKVMDIDLMTNFETPYFSSSVPEFWRRWHISLSTWFRDYIYIPLGGNRVSKPRYCFNQLITFTISGIWHGAGYTYALWGLLNGFYIVIARLIKEPIAKLKEKWKLDRVKTLTGVLSIVLTFSLIAFSWIFFRANSFGDVVYILQNLFAPTRMDFSTIASFRIYIAAGATLVLFLIEFCMNYRKKVLTWYLSIPHTARLATYALCVACIVLFGAYDNKAFIYFQF